MSSWTPADVTAVAGAEELRISSTRPDGPDRPFITIWVVRAGDDLFVRSAHGTDNPGIAARSVRRRPKPARSTPPG